MSLKKKKALENTPHFKDPDLDNLEKFILDAMTGITCLDDCQFSQIKAVKIYGKHPRTDIMLSPLLIDEVNEELQALLQLADQLGLAAGSSE